MECGRRFARDGHRAEGYHSCDTDRPWPGIARSPATIALQPHLPTRPDLRSYRDAEVPRISILLPCWNAAATVERALDSVLQVRDVPLECVVVDDGSVDGTAAVVQSVADRDPRVVLVRLPTNQGVSNARNRGLAVVRGEWLTFLDADDRLLHGGLSALMRPTRDPAVLAVIGQRIWSDGERSWRSTLYQNPDILQPGRKSIVRHPGLLYSVAATGKIFHRSLLGDLTFDGRVLGDQPWTIRALLRAGDGIEVIDQTVYEWTRPHRDRHVATITSSTRASAHRSADAAVVARGAFLAVSSEIDVQISDDAARLATKAAYAERLFRSDFSGPVRTAIDRRDPATGQLFDALGALLEVIPQPILARSSILVRSLLRPPWYRWAELVPAARSSYWRMVEPVRRADPQVGARIVGVPGLGFAFGLARPRAGERERRSAGLLMAVVGAVARVVIRIRAITRQIR